jgi:signal transduction histidine kinase
MMTYYSISAFINFALSLLLGIFIIYKNPKAKISRALFFWCFTVAFWSLFYFIWQLEDSAEWALVWTRLLMLGAIWVPFGFLLVVLIFLEKEKAHKKFIWFNIGLSTIFSLLLVTPLMVSHIEPTGGFQNWPKPGMAYHFFLAMFIGVSAYATLLSFKALKDPSSIRRLQAKYMLFGITLSIIGGSTNYLLWYNIPIKPYGNIFASTYVLMTVYAILRYRLMDIRFAFRKIFIYIGGTALTYAGFYGVIWTYIEFFGGTNTRNAYLSGLIVGPIFVFVFYRFDKFLNRFANKYLFASLYNTEKTIRELSQQLNTYNDLNKIVSVIINTIKKTMQLDRAGVLLVDFNTQPIRYQIAKVIGFDRTNGISLVQDNFLTRYLEKTQKPLVRDELHLLSRDSVNKKDQESLIKLQEHMVKIEAFLCLPLTSNRKLIGIIVLGSKISGDAYTKEDLELLETLSNQASVAIENARLYKEVADFNKTLREKVDEQTHSLQEKAEHLTKLLEMRSEFLDIASHQLKTPVSVILGTLSMFKEGSIQKLPKAQQDKFIDNIFNKAKKLGTIINDILRASEMDTDQFQLVQDNIKLVSLADLAKVVCEDLKPEAMEKKINLNCSVEGKNNTQIMADADFLNHAISNLVDNAIKYTAKGGVEVKVFEENSRVFLSVKDSGIGIPKADAKKIFEKFNRATNAVDMYTDGSGLGLFIVKKIVEAHAGGQVGFESIEGEGTTFTISFPVIAKVKARNVIK